VSGAPPNRLKAKLAAGERVFGTWSAISSPVAANVLASTGVDFVIVDLEHGPMGLETVETMLYGIESAGATPVVRVGDSAEAAILRVLEIGTRALMCSHVSTPEEAARVAQACRYPPDGTRGLSPFTRIHGYSEEDLPEKLRDANEQMLVGVLVEGQEGIANLPQIAATPGLDMVYLGVYDLSMVAGVPGQLDHPDVLKIVRESVEKIEAAGLVAGSVARDREYIQLLWDAGFRFISYRNDATLLRDALAEAVGWYGEVRGG
jgi:2-keto-3-deoxy-L-rhamnonate aldolase RhmA